MKALKRELLFVAQWECYEGATVHQTSALLCTIAPC